jgi:hypothetical protein
MLCLSGAGVSRIGKPIAVSLGYLVLTSIIFPGALSQLAMGEPAKGVSPVAKPLSSATSPGFERFRNEKDPWKVLDDKQVKNCLKSIMGKKG